MPYPLTMFVVLGSFARRWVFNCGLCRKLQTFNLCAKLISIGNLEIYTMHKQLSFALLILLASTGFADPCTEDGCCKNKGGIQYCDSSAGRYVCTDGDYSSCYCNRHAVMDLQKFQGCCTWQGGVMKIEDETGLVICNNGGTSDICSIQHPIKAISLW